MFGRNWKHATATVILAEHFVATGTETAGQSSHTRMVLEVHPTDEPPFRAKVTLSHLGFNLQERRMNPPQEGETLQVTFDPKNHEKVKVLLDEAHDSHNNKQRDRDKLDEALNAPIGSRPTVPGLPGLDDSTTVNVTGLGDLPPGTDIGAMLQSAGIDLGAGGGGNGTVEVHDIDSVGVPSAAPKVVSAADILASGTAATAVVQSAELMGPGSDAGTRMVGLQLQVTMPGLAPYAVANMYKAPESKLGSLTLGATLPVKVHPANQQMVAVDWAAV